jgi:hypothetical protein
MIGRAPSLCASAPSLCASAPNGPGECAPRRQPQHLAVLAAVARGHGQRRDGAGHVVCMVRRVERQRQPSRLELSRHHHALFVARRFGADVLAAEQRPHHLPTPGRQLPETGQCQTPPADAFGHVNLPARTRFQIVSAKEFPEAVRGESGRRGGGNTRLAATPSVRCAHWHLLVLPENILQRAPVGQVGTATRSK